MANLLEKISKMFKKDFVHLSLEKIELKKLWASLDLNKGYKFYHLSIIS